MLASGTVPTEAQCQRSAGVQQRQQTVQRAESERLGVSRVGRNLVDHKRSHQRESALISGGMEEGRSELRTAELVVGESGWAV
jgi:hypothetical protein